MPVRLSVSLSVYLSVPPSGSTRFSMEEFLWNFIYDYFSKNLSRKFKFHINLTSITRTLYEDQYAFWSHLSQFFLEWEMVQTKVVEKIKIHILCLIFFFFENRADYEIMCKYTVVPERPRITKRRMRTTCWICNATYTNSEYVILIAFPLQQWLQERSSLLPDTYIACLHITFTCHTLKCLT